LDVITSAGSAGGATVVEELKASDEDDEGNIIFGIELQVN
jgi:hypothetical protein